MRKVLAVLVVTLTILNFAYTINVEPYVRDQFLRPLSRQDVPKCIESGKQNSLLVVNAKCPCYVRFRATQNTPSKVTLNFLVMARSDFRYWKSLGSRGFPKHLSRYSFIGVSLTKFVHSLKMFGFNSRPMSLKQSGQFVLLIQSTSQSPDCNLDVQYVFRQLPRNCPHRLPPGTPPTETISKTARLTSYIVKGTPVTSSITSEFNVLLISNNGKCTGSVIASRWVLTAAHCDIRKGGLALVGGSTVQNGFPYSVNQSIPHPRFTRSTNPRYMSRLVNDIALIQLDKAIFRAAPVKLNNNENAPDPNTIVRVTGYGQLFEKWPSDFLNEVDVPILGLDDCRKTFLNASRETVARGIDNDAHLCTGRDVNCGGGICSGDSGGPLLSRHVDGSLVQVGISSYGDPICGNPITPDVFTRVATYKQWIQNVTNNAATFVYVKGTDRGASNVAPKTNGKKSGLSGLTKSALVGLGAGLAVMAVALLIAIPVRVLSERSSPSRRSQESSSNSGDGVMTRPRTQYTAEAAVSERGAPVHEVDLRSCSVDRNNSSR